MPQGQTVTLDPNGQVPDPTKPVRITLDPSEGFKGGSLTFDYPVESISMLVSNVWMTNGGPAVVFQDLVQKSSNLPEFEILEWDPNVNPRLLRVRFKQ